MPIQEVLSGCEPGLTLFKISGISGMEWNGRNNGLEGRNGNEQNGISLSLLGDDGTCRISCNLWEIRVD